MDYIFGAVTRTDSGITLLVAVEEDWHKGLHTHTHTHRKWFLGFPLNHNKIAVFKIKFLKIFMIPNTYNGEQNFTEILVLQFWVNQIYITVLGNWFKKIHITERKKLCLLYMNLCLLSRYFMCVITSLFIPELIS